MEQSQYCEKVQQLDQQVIDSILAHHSVGFDDTTNRPYYRLEYGGKEVCVYTSIGTFNTYLRHCDGQHKLDDETTYLYAAVKQLFQRAADVRNEVVRYQLSTVHAKMKQWMKNVGELLFDTSTYPHSQFLCMDVEFTPDLLSATTPHSDIQVGEEFVSSI